MRLQTTGQVYQPKGHKFNKSNGFLMVDIFKKDQHKEIAEIIMRLHNVSK